MNFARLRSLLYRITDWFTEGLIYFAILFGPWAFGTTQPWSIQVMNGVGFALGLLWLGKLGLRAVGQPSLQWNNLSNAVSEKGRHLDKHWRENERCFTWLLAIGTIYILLYCWVSAWNARAVYQPDEWNFEYRHAIPWLPHSYDQESSWAAFWKYLGLAGLFWALRDWLLTLPPNEAARFTNTNSARSKLDWLPIRLRRLFWILTINGTVLAFQGLMQRAEGGNKLLWLVVTHYTGLTEQFGPYAYRANAAQYFNLLWPAVLGFWWGSVRSIRGHKRMAVLLPCVLVMAICPLVSSSRGGAIVLVINLVMAAGILLLAQWQSRWMTKTLLLLGLVGVVGGGALLGWKTLAPRMEMIHEGYEGREGLYLAGHYMAQDNARFGTGPGTFETMYQLYRRSESDEWLAYMHNDWLETVITFGWLGALPIFLTLALALFHWFGGSGIYGNKYFVMLLWVSLGGCMIHACFDLPFQIHSVLTLFLVLCAVLSCLSRRFPAT